MKFAFDELRADEYEVASEAAEIGRELVAAYPDAFGHLDGVEIGYLFRDDEVRDHETKIIVGTAFLFTQLLSGGGAKYWNRFAKWSIAQMLGFQPVFVILLDRNLWSGFSDAEKRFWLDHELEHCIHKVNDDGVPRFNQQTGEPIWGIKPHDIEEHAGTIARHGLVTEDRRAFAAVMVDAALRDAEQLAPPVLIRRQA